MNVSNDERLLLELILQVILSWETRI